MQVYDVKVERRLGYYTVINRHNQSIVYTYIRDDITCAFGITNDFDVSTNHEICDKEKKKKETIQCVHSRC